MFDVELYGGKRGYLAHVRARAFYLVGAYRKVCKVDWRSVSRLVFVCKGNICRSPYASARTRLLGIPAVSFGLDAVEGARADSAAARNALMRDVDLSAHRAAKWDAACNVAGDLLVVFEPAQLPEVWRRSAEQSPRVTLLGLWARSIHPHIQDPYGRSDRYFQRCFSIIDQSVAEIAKRMAGSRPVTRNIIDRTII